MAAMNTAPFHFIRGTGDDDQVLGLRYDSSKLSHNNTNEKGPTNTDRVDGMTTLP